MVASCIPVLHVRGASMGQCELRRERPPTSMV